MKRCLLLSLFLTGCVTTSKVTSNPITSVSGVSVRADCNINEQNFSEDNLELTGYDEESYFVKASDGKTLGLPQNQCILSQIASDSPHEGKLHWVKCKMGKVSFVSDDLTYNSESKNFYKLTRKDGRSWFLPRVHCSIYGAGQ